jgi:hypothetical protein
MEFLKIAKQTSNDSYMTITRRVVGVKGLAGTLDGFLPWGLLQACAKGSIFSYGQAVSMNFITKSNPELSKDSRMVFSGMCGGFIQGVAMSPLLLLKTRVMTDPSFRASGGILQTAMSSFGVAGRIIANEGPGAIFKGMGAFSIKRAADWTTRYLFVVMVENAMRTPGKKLTDLEEAFASVAGGAISALSTIPLDVLVASKQSAGSAGKSVGAFETFSNKIKEHGVIGTLQFSTKGLVARVIHVGATTLAMKKITSMVCALLVPLCAKRIFYLFAAIVHLPSVLFHPIPPPTDDILYPLPAEGKMH